MGNLFSISIPCDNVLSRCSDCTAKHHNYAFQLDKNLHLLRSDWDRLKRKRNDIKNTVEVEERDQRVKRTEVVDGWLLRVEAMEAQVEEVITDGSQESMNKCFGGCCPKNCKTSYKLGKKVVKFQQEVTDLLSEGAFDVLTNQVAIARHLELEKNLDLLRNDWDRLKRRKNDIKRKVEDEEFDQRMKRLEEVDGWLLQVDAMEDDIDNAIRDASQESLGEETSYELGNKVAKFQQEVTDLLSKAVFGVLTSPVSLPLINERPAEQTVGFESIFDEVWSYIEDEKVGIMGLYGMGGVGKTTLLTQIHNKLRNSTQGFDVVIWIVVSKTPNLTKLQDDIGEKIGFHGDGWKKKSQDDKAIDILRVLKEKKYVLMLDDIWERIDLMKLGIPPPKQTNKSKVVFTTRSEVVCGSMEAHKQIKVKCLGEKEAWDLFQKKVGEKALSAHPDIPELAKVVAKECDGLPLALITIGRAMACKTTPELWHHAIDLLKSNASKFAGMEDGVFSLLKFSYDSLPNEALRSCLLYCSLYPEDFEISKQELIDQWSCEGFLDELDDLQKARYEGFDYISGLIHASLLEEVSVEKIKMHDVIRDMSIWIACECGAKKNKFFVQAVVGWTKLPDVEKFKGSERVSMMRNQISTLTGRPKCPNLLTLLLNDCSLERIDNGFFQSMPKLRVLNLSSNWRLDRLPEEICELVSLEYLNFSNTGINEVPINLQKLINLKWLKRVTGSVPKGVLSSFKKLQVLNLFADLPETFVTELESLKYLQDLSIRIRGDIEFSGFSSSHKLTSITTCLVLYEMTNLDLLFLKKMKKLEDFRIMYCRELENIIIGEVGNETTSKMISRHTCCFNSLRSLYISSCPKLKDVTWLTFAPNIEIIEIFECYEMKEMVSVWKLGDGDAEERQEEVVGRPTPFAKLTTLHLIDLPEMEIIYPVALPFPCLEVMDVFECPKLTKLPFNSSSCSKSASGIPKVKGPEEWWNGLEWEDEATRLAFLPSFQRY